jgi:hypothetical protein
MGEFRQVSTTIGLDRIDKLWDLPLKENERVEIMWPDGTTETHRICIERSRDVGERVGHVDDRAFVFVKYCGAKIRVYLRNRGAVKLRRAGFIRIQDGSDVSEDR